MTTQHSEPDSNLCGISEFAEDLSGSDPFGFGEIPSGQVAGTSKQPSCQDQRRSDLFSLPMADFLQVVLCRCQAMPDSGTWRSPLFDFTRWVKARRELAGLDGYSAAEHIERDLRTLAPEGNDPWEYHFEAMGTDDGRAEFIDTWGKIRTPADMDILQSAARNAETRPLQPNRRYSPKFCQLVSVAGHLQSSLRDEPIALPVERLAELIGCDRRTIGTYLKFALTDGLLRKTSDCVPRHRAAEFIFAIDRFDWKTGRQIR